MISQCLNGIITKNLAIDIDISNLNSWNLNSGYTVNSLVNWNNKTLKDLNLLDFGLTGFDNARTISMNDNILLSTNDKFTLYRIGYNTVINPITGETSGYTANTYYDLFPITGITTGLTGNYLSLNGGYLQGFFKLYDYDYELFPSRFNDGITIETLLNINTSSEGIFYLMGLRAEDKYNTYFSGETSIIESKVNIVNNTTGNVYDLNGILTSENNNLIAINSDEVASNAFVFFEDSRKFIDTIPDQLYNLKNNIIAFELTSDKKIGYRYINSKGLFESNISSNKIQNLGWNIISIVFRPNELIDKYDVKYQTCYPLRKGNLIIYVNGRKFWEINDFEEFYFRGLNNDKEKQIGVPYNISWGGGSYGLEHSYHYDYNLYDLYNENSTSYINNKYFPQYNPTLSSCIFTGNTDVYQSGLILSANTITFNDFDSCNNLIPLTVMDIVYTGTTGQTNTNYFIKFNQLIKVRPNIEYDIELLFNDINIFDSNNINEISILISGDTEYEEIENLVYTNQLTNTSILENNWKKINYKFKVNNYNIKFSKFYFGFIIKTNRSLVPNKHLYIKEFNYLANDILVKDVNKNNLIIEEKFNSSFIGGIQKLRLYDRALESNEILNNSYYDAKTNKILSIFSSKGGRIIYTNNATLVKQWEEYINLDAPIDLTDYILE